MILTALNEAFADANSFGDVTINQLRERTGLAEQTVRDNVNSLRAKGEIETYRGNGNVLWVTLP